MGKKVLKWILYIFVVFFALIGIYQVFFYFMSTSVRNQVIARDKVEKIYDKDLLYQIPDGEPLFLVDESNDSTVFIIGGFRAAHFLDYFNELHEKEAVNVIAPIAGLTSWPFDMRNREWTYHEDMRTFLQIYDAYCANLPKDHRVVVLSMSFGALSNTMISIRGEREPDAMIFLSPLNTHLDYRAASPLMAWLSDKIEYLQYIKPLVMRTSNPKRAGMWDIVNDELNQKAWNDYGTRVVNWEENLSQAVIVREAADYFENDLMKRVKDQKIMILHGDDDLFFQQDCFKQLEENFKASGNTVSRIPLQETGHMVLNDNGQYEAKKIIAQIAHDTYQW